MRYITKKQAREIWYTFRHNTGALKDTKSFTALEREMKRECIFYNTSSERLLGNQYGDKLVMRLEKGRFKYSLMWYGTDNDRYPNHKNPKYPLIMKNVFNKSYKNKSKERKELMKNILTRYSEQMEYIKAKYPKLYMEKYTKLLNGSWVLEF